MNTLAKIIRERADYVKNSGFRVEVDYTLPTVLIAGNDEEIFLQEHQAQEFIDGATNMWEEARTVGMNVALHSEAKIYVDGLV